MMHRTATACVTLALIAACSSESQAPSAEQDRDMDQVAEMLNEAPNGLQHIDDSELRQEQELAGEEGGETGAYANE